MSILRLITGPSGSGKSTTVYKEILARADKERDRNFFVIVPDQAAMSTQKELVTMSGRGGIMNIDVLGFGRLSHRILEETGQEDIPVLDDTGMNLIIRKVCSENADKLPVLGRKLDSRGIISEVKSALSEFMQYGVSPENMEEMIDCCIGRGSLKGKLKDLKTIYGLFEDYIRGHYVTREEKLDILCGAIPSSSILPDSVMVFDGFTGFTPVQMKVISALMGKCSEMIFILQASADEDVRTEASEEDLFYLSHKTAGALRKLAAENGCEMADPENCSRMIPDHDIALLEKNLFRKRKVSGNGNPSGSVHILEMTDPGKEAHYIGVKLRDLIIEKGYAYRDIAVVCGDVTTYAPYFEREFSAMKIPFFMDSVTGLRLDPLVETVQAFLQVENEDYSGTAVTRFLKAGLTELSYYDIDLLDNYIRQTGVRGRNAWHREFTRTIRSRREDPEYLEKINNIRRKVISYFALFENEEGKTPGRDSAGEYTKKLYESLVKLDAPVKLRELKREAESEGDISRTKEYETVWKLFVELFDRIYLLMGDEEVTLNSFADIVDAGIEEMRVPGIPVNVDRVLIGDIERSRLGNVKVLFFTGVNDGNIPSDTSGKGIISDIDREFLSENGIELSPTPRQKMYIQRQYLYMNICKPSDELYLSYCRVRTNGKSVRPSYLIPLVKRILPASSEVMRPEEAKVSERVSTCDDALSVLAELMRDYADSQGASEKAGETFALFSAVGEAEGRRQRLTDSVYKRYLDNPLSKEVVAKLYPGDLHGSVSSLETYAGCPYRYFLNFGLGIKPVDSYEIQTFDRGLLAHEIIKSFSACLTKDSLTWTSFTDEYAKAVIPQLASEAAASYGSALYFDNARNEYNIRRLSRLVINSVCSLRDQLAAGKFESAGSEKHFAMELPLSGGKNLRMTGIVDRVDVSQGDAGKYIQIIDYKSGDKDIDLSMILDGRQIQLPIYMYGERKELQGTPASMLYFHIQDPFLDVESGDAEGVEESLRKLMKARGEVSADPEALALLDKDLSGLAPGTSSEFFNVSIKKDGGFSSTSKVLNTEAFNAVLEEAVNVAKKEAEEILEGKISIEPFSSACAYCPYSTACGMDRKIPGFRTKTSGKTDRKEVLKALCDKYGV